METQRPPIISISRQDWSLHRKGPIDQARHDAKVREAIKGNLDRIISEESIITAEGGKIVKVPIRSLDEYRFRFDPNQHDQVGQGGSGQGDANGGQGQGQPGPGQGPQAGEQPGIDYYEADISIDELAALVFEDLGLPNLQPKRNRILESDEISFTDVRRRGSLSNLDKRRTLIENLKRNARQGHPHCGGFTPDDLRFKTWERTVRRECSAVVIAMMDVSGSMGQFEKYIARSCYFWMVRFLRTKYSQVDIVFLAHHTEAKEVSEEEFFTRGESGGTKVSSVYDLALQIIKERYPADQWNIYPFHFSDGDNWATDNEQCVALTERLLQSCAIFGYGEIRQNHYVGQSSLMSAFGRFADDPRFISVVIRDKSGIYPALTRFFNQSPERAVALRG